MFLKAFRVKSSSQMKGSDKKKLKLDLKKRFPSLSDDDLNQLIPNKEEIVATKIYTFNGDSLMVYYQCKNPLFFEHEKERGQLFPTVYALWQFPMLLSVCFPTWSQVLPKIANGADLMLPGIIVDESLGEKAYHGPNGKFSKGEPVGVQLTNNRAHVAVGTAALSSEDLYMAGRRGKGINILHFYGDSLWLSGTQRQLPSMPPPNSVQFLNRKSEGEDIDDDDDDVGEYEGNSSGDERAVSNGETKNDTEGEALEEVAEKIAASSINAEAGEAVQEQAKETAVEPEVDSRSPQEIMDELLLKAFLQAWKVSAKKIEFPILSSNFFRVHMVAQSQQPLDVKKSTHKKLSKFLACMQKEGLVEVKELQKGVESIVHVNLQHPLIERHRVVKVKRVDGAEGEDDDVLPCDRPYQPPSINELFLVSGATVAFFKLLGLKKGDALTAADVRDKVREYVRENCLQDQGPGTRGQVNLDPLLAGIVLGKGENNVTSLSWEEVGSRLQAKMSKGYSMQFSTVPGSAVTVKKGQLDPIELSVCTRSGNKKVTLVYNLELYGIDPADFAHRCQTGVAASTSVSEAANRRQGAMEVLVQGNQVVFASRLLLEVYKIPRKYIKGIEEAKKKGKKGK